MAEEAHFEDADALQRIHHCDGAHLYLVDAILYMLEAGIIQLSDTKFWITPVPGIA